MRAGSQDPRVYEGCPTSRQFAKIGYTASFKPGFLHYYHTLSKVAKELGVSLVGSSS